MRCGLRASGQVHHVQIWVVGRLLEGEPLSASIRGLSDHGGSREAEQTQRVEPECGVSAGLRAALIVGRGGVVLQDRAEAVIVTNRHTTQ